MPDVFFSGGSILRKSISWFVITVLTALATAVPIQAPANMTFTPSEVQKGLQQNVEQFYYTYKDKPVKNPEHNVTGVKVLHYITHEQLAILVGSCLIDGKENIITGSLYKDPQTGKIHFGGGWMEREHIIKPLYYGFGVQNDGVTISGLVLDRSITQIRVCTMGDEQPITIPVNSEGYYASWVPSKSHTSPRRMIRVWIEGLDKNGKVVYSPRKPQSSEGTL